MKECGDEYSLFMFKVFIVENRKGYLFYGKRKWSIIFKIINKSQDEKVFIYIYFFQNHTDNLGSPFLLFYLKLILE